MATPRSQRIGIWIIAVVLTVGTIGSFLAIIVGAQNQAKDEARFQKLQQEYSAKLEAQTKDLSNKYYKEFSKYAKLPDSFNADKVNDLGKRDLKIGDGATIKDDTEYNAYYIGWNPKGFVFDQSIEDGALKAPIGGGNLITGWEEGVIGMKFGGVRELTIPSDKAYGESGSGEDIPPNTPIKFIVMVIPKVEEIPIPDELLRLYANNASY